jgi:hypothetical protein
MSTPMRRIRSPCCAQAASGHDAAAAPPSRAMQLCGKFNANCFGCLEIEHKLQFGGLLHRQIAGLCAFQNLPGIDPDLTVSIGDARPIIHKAARRRKFAPRVNSRHFLTLRESDKLIDMVAKQRIDANLEGVNSIAYKY